MLQVFRPDVHLEERQPREAKEGGGGEKEM